MGRFIRPTLTLVLTLFIRPVPNPEPAATSTPVETAADESWYEPRAEDFRPAYDRDLANGGKQTWDQYWGWVRSFYEGNLFTKGWNDRARWLVQGVRSEGERTWLRTQLNAVGREICAEWSKDYDVRKVGSADLLTWGKMLEKARTDDDGTGVGLHRAIEEIREAHGRKLASGASAPR
jgi:hypothetical protein